MITQQSAYCCALEVIHLPVSQCPNEIKPTRIRENSTLHLKHRPAIIKQPQHKYRVKPFAQRQHQQSPVGHVPSLAVNGASEREGSDIHQRVDLLCLRDVGARVSERIYGLMDVEMSCWVSENVQLFSSRCYVMANGKLTLAVQ